MATDYQRRGLSTGEQVRATLTRSVLGTAVLAVAAVVGLVILLDSTTGIGSSGWLVGALCGAVVVTVVSGPLGRSFRRAASRPGPVHAELDAYPVPAPRFGALPTIVFAAVSGAIGVLALVGAVVLLVDDDPGLAAFCAGVGALLLAVAAGTGLRQRELNAALRRGRTATVHVRGVDDTQKAVLLGAEDGSGYLFRGVRRPGPLAEGDRVEVYGRLAPKELVVLSTPHGVLWPSHRLTAEQLGG